MMRIRQTVLRLLVTAALGFTTSCAAATAASHAKVPPPPNRLPTAQPRSALVTGADFLTIRDGGLTPAVLQVRAAGDGHLVRTLLTADRATTVLSAAVASDGTVLVAQSDDCTTTLSRLDLNGGQELIRTIGTDVSDVAIDRYGDRIAYLTHPTCTTWRCTGTCAGPAVLAPNVLVVLDLRTGTSLRTVTDNAGHPLSTLRWSPDGTRIAATYMGDRWQLLVFDAARPSFGNALRVPARTGCSYLAATWSGTGLIAAEACGTSAANFSPGRLVAIRLTGEPLASWPLPACIDGTALASTPDGSRTLVQTNIGYGNGSCATPEANGTNQLTPLSEVMSKRLRPVMILHATDQVRLAAY